jgi:CBS domain-containing protein
MRRTLTLVEAGLRADPPVPPADTPWAWISLGSEGRGEMSILTDHGDMALVRKLKSEISGALREERRFLPMLAANALTSWPPPSSLLRRFVAGLSGGRDTFDIKRQGLRPLVDVARVFAVQLRYLDSASTSDRLQHAIRALPEVTKAAEDTLEAYRYLSQFHFSRHLRAIQRGEMPDNNVGLCTLNGTQQNMLKAVFSTVSGVQSAVAHRYGVDPRV